MLRDNEIKQILDAHNIYLSANEATIEILFVYIRCVLGVPEDRIGVLDSNKNSFTGYPYGLKVSGADEIDENCIIIASDDYAIPGNESTGIIIIRRENIKLLLNEYNTFLIELIKSLPDRSAFVYGAGGYARFFLDYLSSITNQSIIESVVVTKDPVCTCLCGNIPVITVEHLPPENQDSVFFIAVQAKFHHEIIDVLLAKGASKYFPLYEESLECFVRDTTFSLYFRDPSTYRLGDYPLSGQLHYLSYRHDENRPLNNIPHFRFQFQQKLLDTSSCSLFFQSNDFLGIYQALFGRYCLLANFQTQGYSRTMEKQEHNIPQIYMCVNEADAKLRIEHSADMRLIPIQTGAAFAKQRITEIADDTGYNRSYKNLVYSEISALYWIWKNTSSPYTGLCHYRRIFFVDQFNMDTLSERGIDVVLTTPLICITTTIDQFIRAEVLAGLHFEVIRQAISNKSPEYLDAYTSCINSCLLHGNNMFVMKRDWLDRYCSWLFNVIDEIERVGNGELDYKDRYIGYTSEILLNVFIIRHNEEMNIALADYRFLS